jgi:hypothetical protein
MAALRSATAPENGPRDDRRLPERCHPNRCGTRAALEDVSLRLVLQLPASVRDELVGVPTSQPKSWAARRGVAL